jgi:hypothetical protein
MTEEALRGWYWAGVKCLRCRVGWLVHVSRSLNWAGRWIGRELSPATEFGFSRGCTAQLTRAFWHAADFRSRKTTDGNACEVLESGMTTLLFTCPNTGSRVQGWVADDGFEAGGDVYEGVT